MRRTKPATYDVVTTHDGVFAIVDDGRWHEQDGRFVQGMGIGMLALHLMDRPTAENAGVYEHDRPVTWEPGSIEALAKKLVRLRRLLAMNGPELVDGRLSVVTPNTVLQIHNAHVSAAVDQHLSTLLSSAFGTEVPVEGGSASLSALELLRVAGKATQIIGLFEEAKAHIERGEDGTELLQSIAMSVLSDLETRQERV